MERNTSTELSSHLHSPHESSRRGQGVDGIKHEEACCGSTYVEDRTGEEWWQVVQRVLEEALEVAPNPIALRIISWRECTARGASSPHTTIRLQTDAASAFVRHG